MASQVIDSLLQSVAAKRSVEPPSSRAGDGRDTFAPVLDRALRPGERPTPRGGAHDARDEAEHDAEPTSRVTRRDGEAADDEAVHDTSAAATTAAPSAQDSKHENASTAPHDGDDGDAAEISAEAAAAVAAQSAANIAAADNAADDGAAGEGDTPISATQAAAEAAAGDDLPDEGAPFRATATDGQDNSELGDAPAATDATELGDVPPKQSQDSTHTVARVSPAPRPNNDQDGAENSPALVTVERAESATLASPQSVPDEPVDDASQAPLPENPETDVVVESEPTASNDTSPLSDDGGREAHRGAAHGAAEPAEAAIANEAAAPPADGAAPEANDAPDDRNAPQPVAPPSAAESAPARGAAALARLSAGRAQVGSGSRSNADEPGQVDRARFLGRVEGAIRSAQQRDGRVQVRLSPPELGSLRIELTVQHGVLSARLEAETTAARNLLLDNLPALRDRLAQQDIRVERFDVDVRRDGGGSNQQGAQDRPAGDPGWQEDGRRERTAARQAEPTRGPRVGGSQANSDAALDVRV